MSDLRRLGFNLKHNAPLRELDRADLSFGARVDAIEDQLASRTAVDSGDGENVADLKSNGARCVHAPIVRRSVT